MNLLFIVGSFYPAQDGGPNNSLFWLAKNIKNNKSYKKVTVLSFFKNIPGKEKKKYKIKPNKVCNIEGLRVIYCKYYLFRIFSPYRYYFIIFKLKKYNLVHLNSIFFYINFFLIFVLNFLKVKYCISPRGETEKEAIIYKKKLKLFYLFFLKKILGKNILFHTTSDKENSDTRKIFGKQYRYYILRNLIEINKIKKKINFKNLESKKNLLYLGRIHPKKNLENCINAFIKSFKNFKDKNIKFIIAGTGSKNYINSLKQIVFKKNFQDKVLFIGFIKLDEKKRIFRNTKFLILTSHSENFGNVILESILNETPVLVSKNLPWSNIKRFNVGHLFAKNEKETSLTLISKFNSTTKKYKSLFKNMAKFIEFYDASKKSHLYSTMYSNAISPNNYKR